MTHTHTCASRTQTHMTTMVTNAAGVSSNFIACIIHEYFNLMSIIRHNMPTLLKQGNGGGGGDIEWQGVTPMYDDMNSHQKAVLSCVRLSRGNCVPGLFHHPLPPAVVTDYY